MLATADRVAAELQNADEKEGSRPGGAPSAWAAWLPGVWLMTGAVAAARQDLPRASGLLRRGLAGAVGDSRFGRLDRYQMMAAAVEANRGDLKAVSGYATDLAAATDSWARLAALRCRMWVLTARGEFAAAMDAADTAEPPGRLAAALLRCDVASILASWGRVPDAVAVADEVLEDLSRTTHGSYGAMASTQAVATASWVGLFAAHAGDVLSASRMAWLARDANTNLDHAPLSAAQLGLAGAALSRASGEPARGQAAAATAARTFGRLGAEPGRAMAIAEEGLCAAAAGHHASSGPLLAHAAASLAGTGQQYLAARVRELGVNLEAGGG